MATQTYLIRAAHVADRLKLKDLKEITIHPVELFTNYEMVIRYGVNSYAFIYNYGSIVFFNVPDDLQVAEIARIRQTKEGARFGDTSDVYVVEESKGLSQPHQVFFDRVILEDLSFLKIKIICILVAESTALDHYDILIEDLLERATRITKRLEQEGKFIESKEDLMKFVGMCLSSKQELISNLYIVDSPDETWDRPDLDKLFHELKQMFEIDVRYRALEYKSRIIQESIEVITDLIQSKRAYMLELTIIGLIGFEILMSLYSYLK